MRGSYPVMRPMFGTPMPVRPIRYGPNQPFGGFQYESQMSFRNCSTLQTRPNIIIPLHIEHNYPNIRLEEPQQPSEPQMALNYNNTSQLNEVLQQNNHKFVYQIESTDLSTLMTNFLPPMTNPNTRVTQVFDNDFNDKEMKDETEVNKIEIARVKNEIVPHLEEDHFLSGVVEQSLVNNGIKVIVKRNNESFDELMETCVSGDDFNPSH
jgi:hypothetical protein